MPRSHKGIALVLNTRPYGHPGSIPGRGVFYRLISKSRNHKFYKSNFFVGLMEPMAKPPGSALIEIMKIDERVVHAYAFPYDNTIVPKKHPGKKVGYDGSKGAWLCYGGLLGYPVIMPLSSIEHLHLQESDMFDCQINQNPKQNVVAVNLEQVTLSEEERERNRELRENREVLARSREVLGKEEEW